MMSVRWTQIGWLGALLGLFVACNDQVRNLGDEGAMAGAGAKLDAGARNASAGSNGGGAGGATTSPTGATSGTVQATGGVAGGATLATGGVAEGGTGQEVSVAGMSGNSADHFAGSGGRVGAIGTTTCPSYHGTGGTLITPPSTDFESEVGSWTTFSARASGVRRVQGPTNACDGSWYLTCEGASRAAGWDGPAIDISSYVVVGHQYVVTLAARFDPANVPGADAAMRLISSMTCVDSSVVTTFTKLQELATTSSWIRLSGSFDANLPGCTQLGRLMVYVETDDSNKAFSLDVDDFQMWDVTP